MQRVRDAVIFVNDQIGIAPRALAGYMLAACTFHRVSAAADSNRATLFIFASALLNQSLKAELRGDYILLSPH